MAMAVSPIVQVLGKTLGLQHRVPAGSLHLLLQLLPVQGLQPAKHGLVHGL